MSLIGTPNARNVGLPFTLYKFVYGEGSGDVYCYTDFAAEVGEVPIFESNTYTPVAIAHEKITVSGRPKQTGLKVTLPSSTELAALFRGYPPRRVIYLFIYAGYLSDQNVPGNLADVEQTTLVWSGRVAETSPRKGLLTLTCETLGAGMRRPGLGRFYMRECPHVLYGSRCQADKNAATRTVAVVNQDNVTLQLEPGWQGSNLPGDFIGGVLEHDGTHGQEVRMIVTADTVGVTLDGPLEAVGSGTVRVVLGCPRVLQACIDLHNNSVNYGGFPYIPVKNPTNKNVHT